MTDTQKIREFSFDEVVALAETKTHILRVNEHMSQVIGSLHKRALAHDRSKLFDPELSVFAEFTPKLGSTKYGSDEYKQFLKDMKPALDHHYANNTHHPEHFPNGVRGMSLLDLIEMICDWKASTERTMGGDLNKSLAFNKDRFGISDDLYEILQNTVRELYGPSN
jgi:hypothetical protein